MFLGSRAAAAPYVIASKLFTVLYFAYFLLILPALAVIGEILTKNAGLNARKQPPAVTTLFHPSVISTVDPTIDALCNEWQLLGPGY